jgi:hypothetical protein
METPPSKFPLVSELFPKEQTPINVSNMETPPSKPPLVPDHFLPEQDNDFSMEHVRKKVGKYNGTREKKVFQNIDKKCQEVSELVNGDFHPETAMMMARCLDPYDCLFNYNGKITVFQDKGFLSRSFIIQAYVKVLNGQVTGNSVLFVDSDIITTYPWNEKTRLEFISKMKRYDLVFCVCNITKFHFLGIEMRHKKRSADVTILLKVANSL